MMNRREQLIAEVTEAITIIHTEAYYMYFDRFGADEASNKAMDITTKACKQLMIIADRYSEGYEADE